MWYSIATFSEVKDLNTFYWIYKAFRNTGTCIILAGIEHCTCLKAVQWRQTCNCVSVVLLLSLVQYISKDLQLSGQVVQHITLDINNTTEIQSYTNLGIWELNFIGLVKSKHRCVLNSPMWRSCGQQKCGHDRTQDLKRIMENKKWSHWVKNNEIQGIKKYQWNLKKI